MRHVVQSGLPLFVGGSCGPMQLNLFCASVLPFLKAWKLLPSPTNDAVPESSAIAGPGARPKSQSVETLQCESDGERPSHCSMNTFSWEVKPVVATTSTGSGLPTVADISPGTAKGLVDGVVIAVAKAAPAVPSTTTAPINTTSPRREMFRRRMTLLGEPNLTRCGGPRSW
jgi:hypothetical protein